MDVVSLKDVPFISDRAVIININTKLVTTLALLSAIRYSGMRVLLLDCGSTDGSFEHFTKLSEKHGFDIASIPLQKHGLTLDQIFRTIRSDRILLLDSDIEILNAGIINQMKEFVLDSQIFGTGFIHGPEWLDSRHGVGHHIGLYQERMWIPISLLNVNFVRQALNSGVSFNDRCIFNDFSPIYFISKILFQRFRIPLLKNSGLRFLNTFKTNYYGLKPCYIYCDTGAEIYQFLKYKKGYDFVGYPARLHEKYVKHYHGATRGTLNPSDLIAVKINEKTNEIRKRISSVYGIDVSF